ncbi:hypothetical protein PsorP6_016020 [Peronosclerospora sorghi]|uniref:Uncharacterized protein n=1 Tax=Peronosclerospora sorghi TaxID=230839 RepID=A0ACC0WNR8_9STRA|nr:hypothetical protein PsorP6_016020 [Peronosclerospora sorghi]
MQNAAVSCVNELVRVDDATESAGSSSSSPCETLRSHRVHHTLYLLRPRLELVHKYLNLVLLALFLQVTRVAINASKCNELFQS